MNDVTTAPREPAAEHGTGLTPAQTYDQYLGPAMFAPWARVLLDIAGPGPGERALDLACGTGIVTKQLASRLGESGEVIGVDVSEDMLTVAHDTINEAGAPIGWLLGNACALDAEDGYFDLVVCQQGFQFFPDKPAAAGEMHRVLNATGRAVVAVWKDLDHHPVFRALFEAEARHLGIPVNDLAVPFSFGNSRSLKKTFRRAGFSQVAVTAHSLGASFPDPERFIELVVMAGAAVIPELDQQSPQAHEALLDSVKRDAEETVSRYRQGRSLNFPMHANIVVASV